MFVLSGLEGNSNFLCYQGIHPYWVICSFGLISKVKEKKTGKAAERETCTNYKHEDKRRIFANVYSWRRNSSRSSMRNKSFTAQKKKVRGHWCCFHEGVTYLRVSSNDKICGFSYKHALCVAHKEFGDVVEQIAL